MLLCGFIISVCAFSSARGSSFFHVCVAVCLLLGVFVGGLYLYVCVCVCVVCFAACVHKMHLCFK